MCIYKHKNSTYCFGLFGLRQDSPGWPWMPASLVSLWRAGITGVCCHVSCTAMYWCLYMCCIRLGQTPSVCFNEFGHMYSLMFLPITQMKTHNITTTKYSLHDSSQLILSQPRVLVPLAIDLHILLLQKRWNIVYTTACRFSPRFWRVHVVYFTLAPFSLLHSIL